MKFHAIIPSLVLAAALVQSGAAEQVSPRKAATVDEPEVSIQSSLTVGNVEAIDQRVEKLVATKARDVDGRPKLFLLEQQYSGWLELPDAALDSMSPQFMQMWKTRYPKSAYRPIVAAMMSSGAAWRARGRGFASTVTPEGWRLFGEHNREAWQVLMDNRETSSRIPSWYSNAILIGYDAGMPPETLRKMFDEGIARHRGYLPIYFAYMRAFAPRWGGSFRDADEFIVAQVAAPTNVDGEALYTRLYWVLDQYNGQDPEFFEHSSVSWRRMRKGFEAMMKQYPGSEWNRANFASYACRAHDGEAYGLLRPKIQPMQFWNAAPDGISLDVCDARFFKST